MKNFIPLYNLLITLKLNHMRSNQFLKWIKEIDSSYKIRPDCWIKRREGLSNSIWGHGSRAVDKTNKQKKNRQIWGPHLRDAEIVKYEHHSEFFQK